MRRERGDLASLDDVGVDAVGDITARRVDSVKNTSHEAIAAEDWDDDFLIDL
jgi:hypothetical protein